MGGPRFAQKITNSCETLFNRICIWSNLCPIGIVSDRDYIQSRLCPIGKYLRVRLVMYAIGTIPIILRFHKFATFHIKRATLGVNNALPKQLLPSQIIVRHLAFNYSCIMIVSSRRNRQRCFEAMSISLTTLSICGREVKPRGTENIRKYKKYKDILIM